MKKWYTLYICMILMMAGLSQQPDTSEMITENKKVISIDTLRKIISIPPPFGPIKHTKKYFMDTVQIFDSLLIEDIEIEIMKLNNITFDSTNRVFPADIPKDSLDKFKLIYYTEYSLETPTYTWAGTMVYSQSSIGRIEEDSDKLISEIVKNSEYKITIWKSGDILLLNYNHFYIGEYLNRDSGKTYYLERK